MVDLKTSLANRGLLPLIENKLAGESVTRGTPVLDEGQRRRNRQGGRLGPFGFTVAQPRSCR